MTCDAASGVCGEAAGDEPKRPALPAAPASMYDLPPGDVNAFVEAELPRGTYRLARPLGERCVERLAPPR